jgi:hypothetical protein
MLDDALGVRVPQDLREFWAKPIETWGFAAEPLRPEEILEVDLPVLPLDFMPVAGDGSGSFLCARLGPKGDVLEMVFWEHDDYGHALPCGRTFAESLLVAAAGLEDDERAQHEKGLRWALAHVEPSVAKAVKKGLAAERPLAEVLVELDVGVESLAEPGLEVHGSRNEIHDEHFQRYYKIPRAELEPELWYDFAKVPKTIKAALRKDYGGVTEPSWDVMEKASAKVLARRSDIGWAWVLHADLAGRRGDREAARVAISHAAMCLQRTFHLHGEDMLRGVRGYADATDPVVKAFLAHDAKAMARHWGGVGGGGEGGKDAWDATYRRVHHMRQPRFHDDDVLDAYARATGAPCWSKLVRRRAGSRRP